MVDEPMFVESRTFSEGLCGAGGSITGARIGPDLECPGLLKTYGSVRPIGGISPYESSMARHGNHLEVGEEVDG